jgi:hypothetical protein
MQRLHIRVPAICVAHFGHVRIRIEVRGDQRVVGRCRGVGSGTERVESGAGGAGAELDDALRESGRLCLFSLFGLGFVSAV